MSIGYPHMLLFKKSVEKKIPLKLRYLQSTILKRMGFGGGVFFAFPTITAIRKAIANDIIGIVDEKGVKLMVRSLYRQ